MYHHAKRGLPELPEEVDGRGFKTTLAQQAQKQAAESFKSWRKRGKPGDSPRGDFGDGDYLSLRSDDVTLTPNDSGYGLKTSFISYNPVWFGVGGGAYQREFLDRIADSDDSASLGSAELHLENDSLEAHLTISWDVDSYRVGDVNTTVGVDLNDDPLAAAAVWSESGDSVEAVEMVSGSEFRHYRERMKQQKDEAMRDDNLKAVVDARRDYQKYTEHVTHMAARRVVDLAVEQTPCRINLEDLTHLRETVDDPIHDWPYAEIQEKIVSKAQEEGIPVTMVDPRNTSTTCRKCGETNPAMRQERQFECWECGYEVHADVNAAVNIAQR
jgi:IS605 OrfB family transposase